MTTRPRGRVFGRVNPALLVYSLLFWILGALLVAFGIMGDSQGWWSDRPFLTNLVSTVTGAAFGIPVAVVVLGEVANRQRRHAENYAAWRTLAPEIEELAAEADLIVTLLTAAPDAPENLSTIHARLIHLQTSWLQIRDLVVSALGTAYRADKISRLITDLSNQTRSTTRPRGVALRLAQRLFDELREANWMLSARAGDYRDQPTPSTD